MFPEQLDYLRIREENEEELERTLKPIVLAQIRDAYNGCFVLDLYM